MIRVLVVEDVRALGEMIAAALCANSDIEVTGAAANLEQIKAKMARCDVIMVNAVGDEFSLQLIRDIRKLDNQAKIVMVGLAGTPAFVLQCVGAGVTGYTLPESSLSDLLRTLRAVHHNETPASPYLAAAPGASGAEVTENYPVSIPQPEPRLLTRREREVLSLVQQGLTNLEIAQLLVIELGTVKNHVHNILRKLRINSRRDTLHLSRVARVGALGGWREQSPEPNWNTSPLSGLDGHVYSHNMARATSYNNSAK